MTYSELPVHVKNFYNQEYFDDVEAQISIKEDMGIIGFERAILTYIKCNHGGFDFEPDFDAGAHTKKEYWNCGQRFKCKAEGKVCKPWIMTHYGLSVREIQVIKNIAEGYTDIEIADNMILAPTTILSHKKNIHRKLSLHSKADITRFAKENNII
jgi:DNA-binding CsgD family transcriptional regulator